MSKRYLERLQYFSTQIIQKDLILEVNSTFLSYEEQTKAELATLGQEKITFRSDLREYNVNAIAVNAETLLTVNREDKKLLDFVITVVGTDIH